MAETIRYARIGKEDINLGTGTFEVRLADGRVVVLTQVDLADIISDAALSSRVVDLLTATIGTLTVNTALLITQQFQVPEKVDPASPVSGELWINSGGAVIEYADDAATPAKHAVVADDTTQTLTNKTLTAPTISGPTLSGTVVGTYNIGGTPTLVVALDVNSQDFTNIDEAHFVDAATNASVAGRMRRNGANLTWHDTLQAHIVTFNDKTQTLQNKTFNLGSNTLSGTKAQFDTALSDDNFTTPSSTDTFTNKTFNAQGTGNSLTNVGTTALKTATGSATLAGLSGNITMNDYAFFPSLTSSAVADTDDIQVIENTADPGNTTGRFYVFNVGGSGTLTARWRYVTTSDDPTIWVVYDPVTGAIKSTWCSDDPTPNDDPGVKVAGLTSTKVKAQQLTGLAIAQVHIEAADARIAARGLNPNHRLYRALQVLSNDDAPSHWLLDNCKMELPARRLVLK